MQRIHPHKVRKTLSKRGRSVCSYGNDWCNSRTLEESSTIVHNAYRWNTFILGKIKLFVPCRVDALSILTTKYCVHSLDQGTRTMLQRDYSSFDKINKTWLRCGLWMIRVLGSDPSLSRRAMYAMR